MNRIKEIKLEYGIGKGIYKGEIRDGVPHGKGQFDQVESDFEEVEFDVESAKNYYKNDISFNYHLDPKNPYNDFPFQGFEGQRGYWGDFKKGLFHGRGVLIDSGPLGLELGSLFDHNGNQKSNHWLFNFSFGLYVGEFKEGLRHGNGKFVANLNNLDNECLETYEGQWHKGLPEGKGKAITTRGRILEGEFHKGKFMEVDESKKN